MTLASYASSRTVKAMAVGFPGTAKTGSLACLANAGYSLRVIDLDGNHDPLLEYIEPENYKNVHLVVLKDRMRFMPGDKATPGGLVPAGAPKAFETALRLFDRFKYKTLDGEEIDLGPVSTWGTNDVLVVDSLTAMGEAAMARTLFLQGRTGMTKREKDWGLAQADQDNYCDLLSTAPCHVIVTAHLKLIGPKDIRSDDSSEVKEQKEKAQQIVPFRLYPSALGRALPPTIARHFAFLLRYEAVTRGRQTKRVISAEATEASDAKLPLAGIPDRLDIADGLLRIFDAVRARRGEPAFAKETT